MEKSASIAIDTTTGTLSISGALFVGERVAITFTGVDYVPRICLLAHDNETVLADNSTSSGYLDLRYDVLRNEFGDCSGRHTYTVFAYKANSDIVLARGTATVRWSPFAFDPVSGAPVTMRGEKGDKGEKGDAGADGIGVRTITYNGLDAAGNNTYTITLTDGRTQTLIAPKGNDATNAIGVLQHTDGTWHRVYLTTNAGGERVVTVDENAIGDSGVTMSDIDTTLATCRNAANIAKLQLEETTCAVYVGEAKTAASAAKKQLEETQKGAE